MLTVMEELPSIRALPKEDLPESVVWKKYPDYLAWVGFPAEQITNGSSRPCAVTLRKIRDVIGLIGHSLRSWKNRARTIANREVREAWLG